MQGFREGLKNQSSIAHSCDIAIINNYTDDDGYERQQYIHFDKKSNRYLWEERSEGYYLLPEKEEWIKENGLQTDLRECYLWRKNTNADPHKRSRTHALSMRMLSMGYAKDLAITIKRCKALLEYQLRIDAINDRCDFKNHI